MGKKPTEVELLSRRWERWSAETDPALPPAALLAGRTAVAADLAAALAGPAAETRVGSDTVAESIAFFAVAMPEALLARAVLVAGAGGWLRLATQGQPLILLPMFEDPDVQLAVAAGHHVLIPEGPRSRNPLPRVDIPAAMAAFQAAGVDGRAASDYARAARRSLSSLRRRLGRSGPLRAPSWADGAATAVLSPLLLAGAWKEDNDADLAVLHHLTDTGWRGLSRQLQPFVNGEDPPLRVQSGRWEFLDLFDTWGLLASSVTAADLKAFHDLLVQVVGELDPVLDLSPEERIYAGVRGVRRVHSTSLRAAMARTVAALGAIVGDRTLQDGKTGQEHADAAVRTLLANDTSRAWASLADVLPDLAEAAPVHFLDAVERALAADGAPLVELFAPEGGVSGMAGSGARHHWLLWALERVALHPRYLARSVLATARLAELDGGRSKGNSPDASLLETLHLVRPQAAVTRTTRRDTLDLLRAQHAEVAWRLLVRLVPSTASTMILVRGKSRWRDWPAPAASTPNELFEGLRDVVTRLAGDVGADAQRLRDVVDVLLRVPSDARTVLLASIRGGLAAADSELKREVAHLLADQVTTHRTYADADWSVPEEEVAAVEQLALELDSGVMTGPELNWFSYWPRRAMDDDSLTPAEADAIVARERHATLQRLLEAGGLDAAMRLAADSEATYAVGFHLAAFDLGADQSTVLKALSGPEPVAQAARGYVARRYQVEGLAWLEPAVASADSDELTVKILRCCPPVPAVLALVDAASDDVQASYWDHPPTHGVEDSDLPAYLDRLLDRDRPWTALALLAFHRLEETVPPELSEVALRVLEALPSTTEDGGRIAPNLTYHLGRLLDGLDAAGADAERLATIEWWFQPMLEQVRHPRALFRQLAADPALFAQLVITAFRPDKPGDEAHQDEGEGGDPPNPQAATAAYTLLRTWHVLPATESGSLLDAETLAGWVARAEALLVTADRREIGLYCIGTALAGPVTDDDGTWPSEPVRKVIEARADRSLEEGLYLARVNQRGVTTRGAYDGGDQERVLAQQYQDWADRVRSNAPRTAALLDGLATRYHAEGREQDDRRDGR